MSSHFVRYATTTPESAGGRRVFAALITLALALPAAAFGQTSEPPAIAPPPAVRVEAPRERGPVFLEGTIQGAFATMGEWSDGLAELENRSRESGSAIGKSNNPAYTTSFEGALLFPLRGAFLGGLQYDRMTGKSEFIIRESFSTGTGPGEFPTDADATSNAWLAVARWMIPGAPRGSHPYLQLGVGAGTGQLEFTTPSGGALGKGRAFASNVEAGFHLGDGLVRVRAAAGVRWHRVPLTYSRVRGASTPGVQRYYFDFDDEVRDFVNGRDVDLSGAFARIGIAFAIPR